MDDDETERPPTKAPEDRPEFAPGDVVAGRYRVERFLGRGAAGEVYGVEDLELGGRAALKLLRAVEKGTIATLERFKREILLARRVSHPNVCRIFEFGVHARPGSETRPRLDLPFLTMELLEGETLASRIAEGGPLADADAIRLALQICRALAAAEAASVVHRDLKSTNILLVGDRAVVTDFGLARSERASQAGASLTEQGGLLGTPAYMAPEQVAGRPATAASDLYALGVVLYEAVTGALPFPGDTPLEVAVKRLNERPVPIEKYRTDLPSRLHEAILRCLEREPERRFPNAAAMEKFLDPPTHLLRDEERRAASTLGGAWAARGGSKRLWIVAASGVAAALAVAAWLWTRPPQAAAPQAVAPAPARSSIAVLGFGNTAARAEAQWISVALAEMLTSEISAGDAVRAVPGESVALARTDLDLAPNAALGEATLARLKRMLGADYILLGSYVALGGDAAPLRLDLRLQATAGGEERLFSLEGSEAGLFELAREAGAELRSALGVPRALPAGEPAVAALPGNPEAVRLYAQGLEALRGFEPLRARELLARAVAADASFPQAHAALAEALTALGYDEEAVRAASEAHRLSGSLPRAEQLAIEGLYRRLRSEWPKAIDLARSLRNFYPDDLELGLRLAAVELESGDARAALTTVEALRQLPPPAGENPRIDLLEARAAESLSDYRRQLAVASRAVAAAESAGARSALVRARFEKGTALRQLGETAAAADELERSRELASALGDRGAAAVASQALARLALARGDLGRAQRLYEEARATFVEIGNRRRAARVDHSLGLLASERGDLVAAIALYERARSVLAELGDGRGAASAAANLGTMLYLQWDLDGAEKRHDEALSAFRGIGDRRAQSVSLANLAQIARDRADFVRSERLWKESLEIGREIGDRSAEASALLGLGENLEIRGEAEAARAELARAQELYRSAGELPGVDAVGVVLARIEREQGRASQAADDLSRLAREFGLRGEADDRLEAELEEARSRFESGPADGDLVRQARAVAAVARRNASAPIRHLGRLVAARAELAAGKPDAARREVAAGLAAAEKAGHRTATFELRLAALEIDRSTGAPAARAGLRALATAARAAGCGRVARRAESLASSFTGAEAPRG